jgi:rubrerythrin
MTNARLFDKLRTLIEDARDADKKHIKKLRKVLRKLKERQNELRDKLGDVDNPSERRKIEQEIAVISLQRGKGAEVYKQLKAARKQRKEGKTSDSAGLAPNPDEPGKTS